MSLTCHMCSMFSLSLSLCLRLFFIFFLGLCVCLVLSLPAHGGFVCRCPCFCLFCLFVSRVACLPLLCHHVPCMFRAGDSLLLPAEPRTASSSTTSCARCGKTKSCSPEREASHTVSSRFLCPGCGTTAKPSLPLRQLAARRFQGQSGGDGP